MTNLQDSAGGTAEAERRRLRHTYARHLADRAALDELTARRVVEALFHRRGSDGRACDCRCHPRLSPLHGDGFDCRCGWDDERRAREARQRREFWDGERAEEAAVGIWLAGQPGVTASRLSSLAPEQWRGTVDGHSFYFRERHGRWRIELDLRPSGRVARRRGGLTEDGEVIVAPVPVLAGEVIAAGEAIELGATPAEHLAFITQVVRDHLAAARCPHTGARRYCPGCGRRMAERG